MKRLIICADGTWNKVDYFDRVKKKEWNLKKRTRRITNVVKITRAILPLTPDGIHQVVHYDEGVGTGFGLLDPMLGGMFGIGLDRNVIECYSFLVHNYAEGDEIYLFGFSRGAFTVRSLAGLIGKIGILTKQDAHYVAEAYHFYRLPTYANKKDMDRAVSDGIPRWLPASIRVSLENKKRAVLEKIGHENLLDIDLFVQGRRKDDETGKLVQFGKRNHPTRLAPIKFIGVWDTVGALGVPFDIWPFDRLNRRVAFHNVELGDRVEHAYHALAVDEKRKPFRPTLWEKEEEKLKANNQHIEQVWFAGYHSDVGGGVSPSNISNFSFRWMVEKAKDAGLCIDDDFMNFYQEKEGDLGYSLHNSMSLIWRPLGSYTRPIPYGKNTYEKVHPSAQLRIKLEKRHEESKERWPYTPSNLSEYLKSLEKENESKPNP